MLLSLGSGGGAVNPLKVCSKFHGEFMCLVLSSASPLSPSPPSSPPPCLPLWCEVVRAHAPAAARVEGGGGRIPRHVGKSQAPLQTFKGPTVSRPSTGPRGQGPERPVKAVSLISSAGRRSASRGLGGISQQQPTERWGAALVGGRAEVCLCTGAAGGTAY